MKYSFLFVLLVVFTNCATKGKQTYGQKSQHVEVPEKITISEYRDPLLSPILLQPNETEVILKDYFPEVQTFDLVSVPEGLTPHLHLDNFVLSGNMKMNYAPLMIKINGNQEYTLVLKNHDKQEYTFNYKTDKQFDNLQIKGSFNGWSTTANPLTYNEGNYTFSTWLSPGTYEYILVDQGKEFNDETNNRLKPNGFGGQNNLFTVGESSQEKVFIYTNPTQSSNAILIGSNQNAEYFNDKLENFVPLWENQLLQPKNGNHLSDPSKFSMSIPIPEEAQKKERSFIRLYYGDQNNGNANDLLIPLAYGKPIKSTTELNRKDFHDNIMYEVFVDRFYNGNTLNDQPVNSDELFPGTDWAGGDLQGLLMKMKEGYFTDLYVNDLWISPINLNPSGMYGHMTEYGVDTKFTGYHGYWPVSLVKIDPHFGNSSTLNEIIQTAHNEDTNIIIDYVANHVHEEHPIVANDMGWITPKYLPDGRKNNRLFEEQRLTTWFDDFMPTLDLEREDVADVMTDSAVYFFKMYDIDGFRHDATKHIPNSFWRTLTYKLKTQVSIPQGRNLYQIGETYGNNELINSYINTGMLDAQFDFNMFDAAFNGILNDDYPLTQMADVLQASLNTYGYHNLMGNISGNHDKGRSISYADGSIKFGENAKEAGYTRKIENINGKLGFEKMAQFFAFNMFIPGIPVIYYGDEIGMPGGDDPDNRRMMQFTQLNENQSALKNTVAQLAKYRREHIELNYGDTQILAATEDMMAILRTYMGNTSILILNTGDAPQAIEFSLQLNLGKDLKINNFNKQATYSKNGNTYSVHLPSRSFDILELKE